METENPKEPFHQFALSERGLQSESPENLKTGKIHNE